MFKGIFGLVTNNDKGNNEPEMSFVTNNQVMTIVSNKTRVETYDGREYLVAPVNAVKPKVLNRELLPWEELAYSWKAWEGQPLTINHPKDEEGNDISAHSLLVKDKTTIGYFHNVDLRWEDDMLRGEVWLDIEKCKNLGGEAKQSIEMVENNENVEVSTGYFRELDKKEGVFMGQAYIGVQRRILPDHLAILPNDIGACSLGDKCGIHQNKNKDPKSNQNLINNGEDVNDSLVNKIVDKLKVIFNHKGGNKGMTEEQRNTLIDKITNCKDSGFSTNSREMLEGMEDSQLKTIANGLECDKTSTNNNGEGEGEGEGNNDPKPATNSNNNSEPIVANNGQANEVTTKLLDAVNNLTAKVETLEQGLKANEEADKKKCIDVIVANDSDFTKEELEKLNLNMLEKLARNAKSDFSLAGGGGYEPKKPKTNSAPPAPSVTMPTKKED